MPLAEVPDVAFEAPFEVLHIEHAPHHANVQAEQPATCVWWIVKRLLCGVCAFQITKAKVT